MSEAEAKRAKNAFDYPQSSEVVSLLPGEAEEGSKDVVIQFKPNWNRDDLTLSRCTDGITNIIIKCVHKQDTAEKETVLVRIYGKKTECLINRSRELENFLRFHEYGIGPELIGTFVNGYVCGYFEGRACDRDEMQKDTVYPLIARQMARMHKVPTSANATPQLFNTLKNWIVVVPKAKQIFENELELEEPFELIKKLIAIAQSFNSKIVTSHNDLLCKNLIYNEEKGELNFIDYEYATANYGGFDIGNHFNEHAGVDQPDFSLCPNKDFQLKFIRIYLAEYYGIEEKDVKEEDVEKLQKEVEFFSTASHFFWGTWALVQHVNSTIDFDFKSYAKARFEEFKKGYALVKK